MEFDPIVYGQEINCGALLLNDFSGYIFAKLIYFHKFILVEFSL